MSCFLLLSANYTLKDSMEQCEAMQKVDVLLGRKCFLVDYYC